jgi:hypothetical protein
MSLRLAAPASFALLLSLAACKKDPDPKGTSGGASDSAAVAESAAVDANILTVTQRTMVYPTQDVKAKTSVMVQAGEALRFLGDSVENPGSKGESIYHVKLSDGSEGWVRNYGVVFGATAVLIADAQVYQRPTALAPIKTTLRIGQLVGMHEDGPDGFVRVVASRWQFGWVLKAALSTSTPDIVAGAKATTAIGKKTGLEAAEAALAVLPDRSTAIAMAFQARVDSAAAANREDAPTEAEVSSENEPTESEHEGESQGE